MLKKILIANRGEIAVRIARACREMGIGSVAVYSDADRAAMHVAMADEAYSLGGNTPAESYLRQDRIIDCARLAHADAIHPGYGFLSENPVFAEAVERAGLKFIGPPSNSIRALGDKTAARRAAELLNIPVIPGTKESIRSDQEALSVAEEIGYPVLLKATAGGGGKGMRVVATAGDLSSALRAAQSEAANAFGDGRVFIEKYIEHPRHIEIQILADAYGHTVYLGERECSIQRRHQKVIEESPSPFVDDRLRRTMGSAATKLVQSVGYVNAGTVEFLIDEQKNFYFLEVNTRLQVEHPVTEMVTGVDLVRQQIAIADGLPLPFAQEEIANRGHAIECRICAEDPEDNFYPSTGILRRYTPPQGPKIRVENGLRENDQVTMFYDPLMAKIIATGADRVEAIETMRRALVEFAVAGVRSTIPFCLSVLDHPNFRSGNYDTRFVDTQFDPKQLRHAGERLEIAAVIAAVLLGNASGAQIDLRDHHNGEQAAWKKSRLESYR